MNDLDAAKYEAQVQLLELLAEIQRNSAPVELSIGWVNSSNIVQQGVVIRSAPPLVTQKLVEAGYCLEITPQGVAAYRL